MPRRKNRKIQTPKHIKFKDLYVGNCFVVKPTSRFDEWCVILHIFKKIGETASIRIKDGENYTHLPQTKVIQVEDPR